MGLGLTPVFFGYLVIGLVQHIRGELFHLVLGDCHPAKRLHGTTGVLGHFSKAFKGFVIPLLKIREIMVDDCSLFAR